MSDTLFLLLCAATMLTSASLMAWLRQALARRESRQLIRIHSDG